MKAKWIVTFSDQNGETGKYVGEKVVIQKQLDGNYYVDGPSWFFQQASFSISNRKLIGQVTPKLNDLTDLFQNTPQGVLQQAEGRIIYTCTLILSEDGKNIYAEHDNIAVNYTEMGTFQNVEHAFGWFKYTFQRKE